MLDGGGVILPDLWTFSSPTSPSLLDPETSLQLVTCRLLSAGVFTDDFQKPWRRVCVCEDTLPKHPERQQTGWTGAQVDSIRFFPN